MITGALIIPLLSTISFNPLFFILHSIIYLSLSIYYYLLINKRRHKDPILYSWLEDKNKSRDLVFSCLIPFIKYSIVIIPFCFMSLAIIDDGNNALDKGSLLSITTNLFPFIWIYSFLINSYHAYKNSPNKEHKQCKPTT